MNTILPREIPGSTQPLSEQLTVSILTNRTLALQVQESVLVMLTKEEVAALYSYLHSNKRMFFVNGGASHETHRPE